MKPLDMRDIAIIDAFPVYRFRKIVLNVGYGIGRIDFHLGASSQARLDKIEEVFYIYLYK